MGKLNNVSMPSIDRSSNIFYVKYRKSVTEGKMWNSLVQSVQTRYNLIARELNLFNKEARLERLVQEIESLEVVISGGTSRDQNGIWKLGCYQSSYANYS